MTEKKTIKRPKTLSGLNVLRSSGTGNENTTRGGDLRVCIWRNGGQCGLWKK